jgi:uncharacterized protein
VRVTVRGTVLPLPAVGSFALAAPAETVTLSVADGRPALDRAAEWLPTRSLRLGGRAVAVEDTDPYRDCHDWTPAERLDAEAIGSWQSLLDDAWAGIHRDAPRYLDGVGGVLHTLVPLRPDPAGRQRSASNRDAFGAVAVAAPANGDELALLLVHEVQHLKLGALLDQHDLVDPGFTGLIEVPWRAQPRPPEAVLQGVYAFMAVADVWRVRGAADHYRRYRAEVLDRVAALRRSGALLPEGQRVVDGLSATIENWHGHDG